MELCLKNLCVYVYDLAFGISSKEVNTKNGVKKVFSLENRNVEKENFDLVEDFLNKQDELDNPDNPVDWQSNNYSQLYDFSYDLFRLYLLENCLDRNISSEDLEFELENFCLFLEENNCDYSDMFGEFCFTSFKEVVNIAEEYLATFEWDVDSEVFYSSTKGKEIGISITYLK